MKKTILIIMIFAVSVFAETEPIKDLEIKEKVKKTELSSAVGDLDKDGIKEKVVVYDTSEKASMGTKRLIHVYKKKNDKWILWHKSSGAVLASRAGGMMMDAFTSVTIKSNAIRFNHFGGSSHKWSYTHVFRYQNKAWKLIGATITNISPDLKTEEFDYNLSNGKIIFKISKKEKLIKTQKYKHKLLNLPLMDKFKPGENKITIKDSKKKVFYF